MKWTTLVHVLIDKLNCLIEVISKLALMAQVLVKLLEQKPDTDPLPFDEKEKDGDLEREVVQREVHEAKRRIVHVRDLVLAKGDYLMNTQEALSLIGVSRGTLDEHREQGLLADVRIGKKGGGVRFIASEVMWVREWYSVRKGKV